MAICTVEDCGREVGPKGARGWCTKHLARFYAHGDPTKATHRGLWMAGRAGASGNGWKGDAVKYRGAHARLTRKYGHPEKCGFCGREGPIPGLKRSYSWALRHEAAHLIVDEKGRSYSPDTNDYVRLCALCHGRYDKAGVPRTFRTYERFA